MSFFSMSLWLHKVSLADGSLHTAYYPAIPCQIFLGFRSKAAKAIKSNPPYRVSIFEISALALCHSCILRWLHSR